MPQEDSFSSQAAAYKFETQLKTKPPTDILRKSYPDLELHLYVLEMHEHLLFKKLAPNGYFLQKRKTHKKTKTKAKNNNNNNNNKIIITKKK